MTECLRVVDLLERIRIVGVVAFGDARSIGCNSLVNGARRRTRNNAKAGARFAFGELLLIAASVSILTVFATILPNALLAMHLVVAPISYSWVSRQVRVKPIWLASRV